MNFHRFYSVAFTHHSFSLPLIVNLSGPLLISGGSDFIAARRLCALPSSLLGYSHFISLHPCTINLSETSSCSACGHHTQNLHLLDDPASESFRRAIFGPFTFSSIYGLDGVVAQLLGFRGVSPLPRLVTAVAEIQSCVLIVSSFV